jgi:hypothetical protein
MSVDFCTKAGTECRSPSHEFATGLGIYGEQAACRLRNTINVKLNLPLGWRSQKSEPTKAAAPHLLAMEHYGKAEKAKAAASAASQLPTSNSEDQIS